MRDDPLRLDLLEDLRLIRLGTGEFSIERLTFAESLTDFLGRGSVEQAFTSLLDYLVQQGTDLEGDVRAYFETCGSRSMPPLTGSISAPHCGEAPAGPLA